MYVQLQVSLPQVKNRNIRRSLLSLFQLLRTHVGIICVSVNILIQLTVVQYRTHIPIALLHQCNQYY